MTVKDLLAKHGITLASYAPGQHNTACPTCSSRDRAYREKKCLGVKIDSKGACWRCSVCGWSGPEKGSGDGKEEPELRNHIYRDADGVECFRKVRNLPGKEPRFWLEQPDGKGGWRKGVRGVDTSIIYRLDEVKKAIKAGCEIACVEGERDADNFWALGIAATCNAHGASEPGKKPKWKKTQSEQLPDANLIVFNDNDPQGYEHAEATCKCSLGIAKRVRRLDLVPHWPEIPKGGDVSDWLAAGHSRDELVALMESAPDYVPSGASKPESGEGEIGRLAKLSLLEYAQQRKAAAKELGDIPVAMLDRVVQLERVRLGLNGNGSDKQAAPALYSHWNVEAASDPVDGGILLRAVKEAIQRYVFMSEGLAVAVTLWLVFSWVHEQMTHSPMLFVTSAERDSGKSTLLGVINFLARRSLQSVDISGPALFRSIVKWQPTLIVDEADDALADNPELRSVINSGWTRGQGVIRCHPDTHEPELFSTFAPKVVAMKGRNLPDTTLSRAIIITMRPRRADDPKEHAADFDHCDTETFVRLRSQLMRWALDNGEALATATPEIPSGFHNRRRANWKPLLAIAEAAGGEWKTAAWTAARAIEAVAATFDLSIGVQLLWAIKVIFSARGKQTQNKDRITAADLNAELVADETAPWATYNKGKPISQAQVKGLLKPYEIKPKTIRLDDGTFPKGYLLEWFTDAFERFCTDSNTPNRAGTPDSPSTYSTDLFSHNNWTSTSAPNPPDVEVGKPFDNSDVEHVERKTKSPGDSAHMRTARSRSDDLPYDGPVVPVPDLGPDPLDEHGAPRAGQLAPAAGNGRAHSAGNGQAAQAEQDLSQRNIDALGQRYQDRRYAHAQETGGDTRTSECDAWLRQELASMGVLPEYIETEFRRVMKAVFRGM